MIKTFLSIATETLRQAKGPLTVDEIWQQAHTFGTINGFVTTGKTPVATLAAQLYTDLKKKGSASQFQIVRKKPTRFTLAAQVAAPVTVSVVAIPAVVKTVNNKSTISDDSAKERDLHALLCAYVKRSSHFRASAKTIYHESSKKASKGYNEWLHPDIAGVYFPFQDFNSETLKLQEHLKVSSVKVFSFELKITLALANLRQYYFQAVSNSSWAKEGYLVVMHIDDDDSLRDEISRLNNAFGIGLLVLNPKDIDSSIILFPARFRQELDWNTLNRLVKENESMKDFLKSISDSMKIDKIVGSYDKILTPDELKDYVKRKNII